MFVLRESPNILPPLVPSKFSSKPEGNRTFGKILLPGQQKLRAPSLCLSSFPPSKGNLHGADGNSHCSCRWAVGSRELLPSCRLQGSYLMLITVRDLQRHILGICRCQRGLSKTPVNSGQLHPFHTSIRELCGLKVTEDQEKTGVPQMLFHP